MKQIKSNKQYDEYFLSLVVNYEEFNDRVAKDILEINMVLACEYVLFEHIVVFSGSKNCYEALIKYLDNNPNIKNIKILFIGESHDFKDAFYCGIKNSIGDYILCLDQLEECENIVRYISNVNFDESRIYFFKNKNVKLKPYGYKLFSVMNRLLERVIFKKSLSDRATNTILFSRWILNQIISQRSGKLFFKGIRYQKKFDACSQVYDGARRNGRIEGKLKRYTRILSEMFSSTTSPLKIISSILLFAAFANLMIFSYAIFSKMIVSSVEPGWASTTIQNSTMFFLISICLYSLIEYLCNIIEFYTGDFDVTIRGEHNLQKHIDKLNIEQVDE